MILNNLQKKALSLFSKNPLKEKFYWTGGTLLAYHYLHHRYSEDLDFFSGKEFSFQEVNNFIQELKKGFGFKKVNYQKIFDRWEFLFENKEKLRIEFVYYNHQKKTLKKRKTILGVFADSLEDIAANKTFALFDRKEPKDLFDIYFLITKKKFSPAKLLKLANLKFGVGFEEGSFWSEAFRFFPLLKEVKPLMVQKNEKLKEKLIHQIETYFKKGSEKFLAKRFND